MNGRQYQNKHHGDTIPQRARVMRFFSLQINIKTAPGAVHYCRLRVDYLIKTTFPSSCGGGRGQNISNS